MIRSKPRYIGETKNQLRSGFGVYNYPKGFFRYEGEWQEGRKHGHGKLIMKDGSFYEGQFENGEISGSGVRKWMMNNNIYEGEFLRGELHGKGIMKYGNGSIYEGDWQENMRQGEGQLTNNDGTAYKGSFYKNKKHGDGLEILRNGQAYEGGWICGSKQGHGVMRFYDGSTYEGQWRSDMFNGEGSYIHCSGASYDGLWVNGRPEVDASELVIHGGPELEVEQGQTFDIEISCANNDGEQSQETGRTLLVTAGIRSTKVSPKSKTSLINDTPNENPQDDVLLTTPFGFDVEPYQVIEIPNQEHQQQQKLQSEASFVSTDSGQGDKAGKHAILSPIVDKNADNEHRQYQRTHQQQHHGVHEDPYATETEKSFDVAKVKFQEHAEERIFSYDDSVLAQVLVGEESLDKNPNERTSGLHVFTKCGKVTLNDLVLPPPSQSNTGSLLRSSPDSEGRLSVRGNKKFDTASVSSSVHNDKEKKRSKIDQPIAEHEKAKDSKDRDSKRKKERKEEKVTEEKFCKPGDYVIMVQDVTTPPFLDVVLQTAYLHVKVVHKSKKTKNTSRKLNAN